MPTQCIYEFMWSSEQTAIFFLYNIRWVDFKPRQCVYCAVRTECLNIILISLSLTSTNNLWKFTLKIALTCSYMIRSTTIIRNLHYSLAKVMWSLRCGKNYVVVCNAVVWQHVIGMVCVLCTFRCVECICWCMNFTYSLNGAESFLSSQLVCS